MVRFATEKDFDFVKNSWSVCFEDTPEFVDWNFEFNYSRENTIVAECDGSLASAMQIIPYNLCFGEEILSTRYVSGVLTMPEFRMRGLTRALFDFGLPEMNCDISLLIPAVKGMYEKFGYRTVTERKAYNAEVLNYKKITEYSEDLIQRLDKIYLKEMSENCIYIKRNKKNWENILTDLLILSKGAVYLSDNGYALSYPKENRLDIWEICGDFPLPEKTEPLPPVMARVIDAKKIVCTFPHIFRENIKYRLIDSFIEKNNFCFCIEDKTPVFCESGEFVLDIADITEMLFKNRKAYINMLL